MQSNLRGHVDFANKFILRGWALRVDDLSKTPVVEVVQNGRSIFSVVPFIPAPQLLKALGIDSPTHGHLPFIWQAPMPLCLGLLPDIPFVIRFREGERPLDNGMNKVVHLTDSIDEGAREDLSIHKFLMPTLYQDPPLSFAARLLLFGVETDKNGELELYVNAAQRKVRSYPFPDPQGRMRCLRRPGSIASIQFTEDDRRRSADGSVHLSTVVAAGKARAAFHNAVRSLWIPDSMFDNKKLVFELPNIENIQRVSGTSSDQLQYLTGGFTTYKQLDTLAKHYSGRGIDSFETVVDWGVGCARVARHFFEGPHLRSSSSTNLVGLDIDPVNIDWCNDHMNGQGVYRLLGIDGDLPLEDKTVDFLYGISVVTHLSEHAQHKWLNEIRRVMRSGGYVVLTTHGEFVYYQEQTALPLPFVEKFGFFDGIPDAALGEDLATYYRASYHSRGYIRANWGKYFDVLDFVAGANAFRQDFVVLRAR